MTQVEYASLSELEQRVIDTNGCDHRAAAELRRRQLRELTGGGRRSPADRLRWLEQHKTPDLRSPREKLLATYARLRHTRNPYQARLALEAQRILGGW
jgi:hypothetical protein